MLKMQLEMCCSIQLNECITDLFTLYTEIQSETKINPFWNANCESFDKDYLYMTN